MDGSSFKRTDSRATSFTQCDPLGNKTGCRIKGELIAFSPVGDIYAAEIKTRTCTRRVYIVLSKHRREQLKNKLRVFNPVQVPR